MNRPAVLLVAVSALAQQALAPRIAERLTANSLRADVSFLASDALRGRATPSRGLEIAAEYIAAQFRRAGLEPGGDEGYFENSPYRRVTPDTAGLSLTFETGDARIAAGAASMNLLEAAALDLAHAPVVSATLNNAASLNALTAEQVRGKALLLIVPTDTPPSLTRGIPAVIDRLDPALVITVRSKGVARPPRARLRDTSAHAFHVPVLAVWDPAIRAAAANGKPATVSVHIAAPVVAGVKLRNVIGVLRGSDAALKNSYLLLTAHYDHLGVRGKGEGDHIYNGANDNASGVASVIEIANALAALPVRPKRSIVFLTFFGEEKDLLGSEYYAHHPGFPLARTIADINLEQLGRTDDSEGPHIGLLNLTGAGFTNIAEVFRRAGEETGIGIVTDEGNSDRYFASSDNLALAEVGVPSTTVSVSYEFPDYHLPGDEWPKLDYSNMAKVDSAIALAVFEMANSRQAPVWNVANPKTEPFVKARVLRP